ncbi:MULTISPECIES: hypothetical protein [unclassified Campylobacter]|uniref:hypothetical protein n=1 Tax=unclassified Campylobacter TaxID=2593542 RepID=UPI001EFB5EB2|nr:hypothetical protein [Campylobacter sp. RM12651]MBZ7976734.1 hypothetical protein [Campylobacter sp. RM12637]ULO02897.1 hypothetical protein AVBRAN_0427 [Campylobacter sp. RM12651]
MRELKDLKDWWIEHYKKQIDELKKIRKNKLYSQKEKEVSSIGAEFNAYEGWFYFDIGAKFKLIPLQNDLYHKINSLDSKIRKEFAYEFITKVLNGYILSGIVEPMSKELVDPFEWSFCFGYIDKKEPQCINFLDFYGVNDAERLVEEVGCKKYNELTDMDAGYINSMSDFSALLILTDSKTASEFIKDFLKRIKNG